MSKLIKLDYLDFKNSLERLYNSVNIELGLKVIQVEDAVSEVLAEDIAAKFDIPPSNVAFYDGYALRSKDIIAASKEKPVKLKVIGTFFPNGNPKCSLKKNESAYVSSGTPLPKGADVVVRFESVKIDGEHIWVTEPSESWDRVIFHGEDAKKGEVMFKEGHMIRPQDIGLLLQLGNSRVRVFRKPRIGVLSIGDEIVEQFNNNRSSYPDNFHMLIKSFFEAYKFHVDQVGIILDDVDKIKEAIRDSCQHYDALLVISGASTGKKDVVHIALQEVGKMIFHGVKLSPGKVSGLALVDGKPVFMIPGHVGSLYVCLSLYVAPVLFKTLCNVKEPFVKVIAKLDSEIRSRPHMSAIRTVQLTRNNGGYVAKVVEKRLGGSGLFTLLTKANGFVVLPPGAVRKQGENVTVSLFNPFEVFHTNRLESKPN